MILNWILDQENKEMSLWLGNRTVKGKGGSCFDLTLQQFRDGGKRVWEIWAKTLQEFFVLCLQLFYKSEIISK